MPFTLEHLGAGRGSRFFILRTYTLTKRPIHKGGIFMASYHLNAGIVSRGAGGSVTAADAYISGEKLRDCYDGKIHDRSYRQDIVHKEVLLPLAAPREFFDRQTLMNALNVSERRSDSQMARTIKIALPNELSFDKCIALVKEFVVENFIYAGLCADIAVHKGLLNENRKPVSIEAVYERKDNPHAHIIVPFRTVGKDGFHRTKTQTRYMNTPAYLVIWRRSWAGLQNREFEKLKIPVRVSHESLAAQGEVREPTKHIGAAAMALEQRGFRTERGDEYRETIARNKERELTREIERQRRHERERTIERSR
jgi:hypothetical protein